MIEQDTGNFLLKVEIKNYNVIIDGLNIFSQPVKSDMRTYNIQKSQMVKEMITQKVVH